MKKIAIILLPIFLMACGNDDFAPNGWADATVNSPAHNFQAPYRIGDSNTLTADIAACTGSTSSMGADVMTTELSASTSYITLTVNINSTSKHTIRVETGDFWEIKDAMINYLCCRIKTGQHFADNGSENLWYDSFFWDCW